MVEAAFNELKEHIEHAANVQQSAIVLIKDMADRLNELANAPSAEAIRELAEKLRTSADELANAIADHEE